MVSVAMTKMVLCTNYGTNTEFYKPQDYKVPVSPSYSPSLINPPVIV